LQVREYFGFCPPYLVTLLLSLPTLYFMIWVGSDYSLSTQITKARVGKLKSIIIILLFALNPRWTINALPNHFQGWYFPNPVLPTQIRLRHIIQTSLLGSYMRKRA